MIGFDAAARYARAIEYLTGAEEIVPPGMVLELDRPEWMALKEEMPYAGKVDVAASVANLSHGGVFNTGAAGDGPRLGVVVERIVLVNRSGLANRFEIRLTTNTTWDSSVSGVARDLRQARGTQSRVVTRTQAAALGLPMLAFPIANETALIVPCFYFLRPQTGCVVTTETTNQRVIAYFECRERVYRAEEMSNL